MKTKISTKLILLTALILSTTGAFGQTPLGVLQERMRERLPQVNQLKQERIIGETNQGYLAIRKLPTDSEQAEQVEKLVANENNDRRQVYLQIGRQQNAPAELVGQRRARQIAENSAPGVWIQKPNGEWIIKPEQKQP